MNTFIKTNWFKLVITLAILVVAVAIGYYYVFFLPNQNYTNQLFTKKANCQKLAESIKNKVEENNNNTGAFANLFGGNYFQMIFYSPKENSCLYAAENMPSGDSERKIEYFIFNALTGNKIISFQFPDQFEDYKRFILEYSNGEIRL